MAIGTGGDFKENGIRNERCHWRDFLGQQSVLFTLWGRESKQKKDNLLGVSFLICPNSLNWLILGEFSLSLLSGSKGWTSGVRADASTVGQQIRMSFLVKLQTSG